MPEPKQTIKNGKLIHYSVGTIIRRDDKYLLIERMKFPFGFAGPAGHIDEGEKPEEAMRREVMEETGFIVRECRLLFHEFIEWNECSRGVKGHDLWLYACVVEGKEQRNVLETKSIGWFSLEEIKHLPLETVWDYIFKKMQLL